MALGTGAYAFTATNTVPNSSASSGSGTISGYTVSAIAVPAERDHPQRHRLDHLHAQRERDDGEAKVVSGSTTYTNCSISGGVNVTCNFVPDIAVTTADELSVIATSRTRTGRVRWATPRPADPPTP